MSPGSDLPGGVDREDCRKKTAQSRSRENVEHENDTPCEARGQVRPRGDRLGEVERV